MFKLIDIIKGGGSNPKLNKFLNRYVISKKEKTNLIKEIKNSKGGSSDSFYFIIYNNHDELYDTITNGTALGMIVTSVSGASIVTGGYTYYINCSFGIVLSSLVSISEKYMCGRINFGHIENYKSNETLPGVPLNFDINNKEDIYNLIALGSNLGIDVVKNTLIEITEEQFFDKEWLLEQARK